MISEANISKILSLLCGLLLAGCFFSPDPSPEIIELRGDVFGSYYIVKYTGDLRPALAQQKLDDLFLGFNNEFSTYQKDSVISRFNEAKAKERIKVSPRFIEMLSMAQRFHQKTEGAFDPTLGPVIKLWGFGGGKRRDHTPSKKELDEALSRVGFPLIKWNETEVWKEKNGVVLDVNAFAPGWVADLVGEILEANNIKNYMADIGGEILFRGEKSPKSSWVAGIEKPSEKHGESVQLAFQIKNLALATSGSYRQFFTENGKRRSHIIDPRTGMPVDHSISSASVIADRAGEADAWGTAMMVLGEKGIQLAEKNGIKVLLLDAKGVKSFEEILSPSMRLFLDEHRL